MASTAGLPGAALPSTYDPAADPNGLGWQEEPPTAWERTVDGLRPEKMSARFMRLIGQGPNEAVARDKYNEGERMFAVKQYRDAASCFKTAARRWPDSLLEEDALFMQGESYFFADHYSRAADAYDNLLKKYGGTRHLEIVSARNFAVGRYWDEMGRKPGNLIPNMTDHTRPLFDTTGNAVRLFESVTMNDAGGDLADDAAMAAGNSYFVRGRYEDAAFHYELLRKEFRDSEHQMQAHLLGLQSQMRSYQGAQYDGKPLEKAEELVTQTMVQFPSQLGEEQERVMAASRWTRFERAKRDWEAAEFYYKQKFYRGARFYYDIVVKDFPDTPFAQMSRDRLEETRGLPPNPPNHFRWLTSLFPESKKL